LTLRNAGIGLIATSLFLAAAPEAAGQFRGWGHREIRWPERDIFPGNVFTFCRVQYTSPPGWGASSGDWRTDAPDSDYNFSLRLTEITTIDVNRDEQGNIKYAKVRLDEPELHNYPFIYMVEVGGLHFSEEEVKRLRDYLMRGGFLMVDDFWGEAEWRNWEYEFSRVFPPDEYPGQQMYEIPLDHPIYNIVFDIDEVPQVPSLNNWLRTGLTYERYDAKTPHVYGVNDPAGRLVAVICHNTDLGDGWEREAQSQEYFREFSVKKAYPMGINIITYAMTH